MDTTRFRHSCRIVHRTWLNQRLRFEASQIRRTQRLLAREVLARDGLGMPSNESALPQLRYIPEGTIICAFGFGTLPEASDDGAIKPTKLSGKETKGRYPLKHR
jgi:hypothetical protein